MGLKKGHTNNPFGRPMGSRNALNQNLLRNTISEKDKKIILKKSIEKAKEGDKDLLKFFLEQIHGKAPQININENHDLTLEQILAELKLD
uniref:DUF5681 domain-containing protein n=1 Tax=viral metagenome TaxID=1070528 RepID=A0A6H1ZX78_9ZZZZ